MEINHWNGLIAVILAVISFYGMTYVVIALNTGWRFGYWLASASFGALMVMLSIFWIVNPVGPRGAEPRWTPLAADAERISQATLENQPLTSPAQYPGGPWRPAEDQGQSEALGSSIANCLSTDPENLPEDERDACAQAQELMPAEEEIPVIEGAAVTVTPEVTDTRFTEENGVMLGQVTVEPITHDPRVAKDADAGQPLAEPFRLVASYDKGSIRTPAYGSLAIFTIYTLIHMLGLHRAEQQKLSVVTA